MKIKNTEVSLVKEDITVLRADAIVNAANNKLLMGGGVAGAIKKNGGSIIEEEAVKKGPIAIGQAVATGAGSLAARYIIHAATMGMDFKTDETKIRNACRSALQLAEELQVGTLVFPALGCGTGGFSPLASAKIMAQEVFRHLRSGDSRIKEITFCLFDQESYDIFQQGAIKYLIHAVTVLQNGPFVTVDAIIELKEGLVLIERSNPPFGWALPGGFVDYGESLEDAVIRETKEETGLRITQLRQFHTYSDPNRDPRFHTIGTVFIAKAEGSPRAGDDAAGLRIFRKSEIAGIDFAFDHKQIVLDYIDFSQGKDPFK
jgi:O-acetyl-ADP-ribose deacetylase (regulator of RNase III)/ADP-ribose pyrophosphatase YjhB (NUDIX family)